LKTLGSGAKHLEFIRMDGLNLNFARVKTVDAGDHLLNLKIATHAVNELLP
jgi:hypothetical protein